MIFIVLLLVFFGTVVAIEWMEHRERMARIKAKQARRERSQETK